MMGFLYPAGLMLAGLSAGVTLLLWMLRRLHRDELTSSTYLWHKLLADLHAAAPWRRLRRELLLALQLLAIIAIGLALARPYRLAGAAPGAHLLIIIDASASMAATPGGGLPLVGQARERALALGLGTLAGGGRVTAIAAGMAPAVLVRNARDEAALRRGLERLAAGPAGADLAAAASLAAAIARGESGARAVILTDRPVAAGPHELPLTIEALGAPRRNLAVAALAVAPGDLGADAVVRLVNRGAEALPYSLALDADGVTQDTRTGTLTPGQAVDLNFTGLPAAGAYAAGLNTADDLAGDNVAYAAPAGTEALQVLLVSQGNLFVEQALSLRPNVRVVRAARTDYAPGPYGLYVLDGWLPPELPPGPLLLLNPPAGQGPLPTGDDTVKVSRVLPGPAAAAWLPVPADDVAVAEARILRPPAGALVLLTAPETPLVVAAEVAGRRVAVFAFDLHQSDLPLRAAFPVLVQNLVGWMAPPAPGPDRAEVGEPWSLDLDPLVTAAEVIAPDGAVVHLAPPLSRAHFPGADRPGVYRVVQHRAGGDRVHRVAVNFPQAESAGAGAALAGGMSGAAAGADAAALPGQRQLWAYLAWAGLALLAGEWWVYSRGG